MKARILVRDWDLEDVHPGAQSKAKVVPFPYRTYPAKWTKSSLPQLPIAPSPRRKTYSASASSSLIILPWTWNSPIRTARCARE